MEHYICCICSSLTETVWFCQGRFLCHFLKLRREDVPAEAVDLRFAFSEGKTMSNTLLKGDLKHD